MRSSTFKRTKTRFRFSCLCFLVFDSIRHKVGNMSVAFEADLGVFQPQVNIFAFF